jgi:hypothetical protein
MITFAMAGIALTTRERGEGDNTPIWREWESLGEITAYFYPYVCSLVMYHTFYILRLQYSDADKFLIK